MFCVCITAYNDHCKVQRTWEINMYEQHLNEDPSPENQLSRCKFVEVECRHWCGKFFQRRRIAFHQSKECPKRSYYCQYCQFESTFETITTVHYLICSMYPVTCPNKCREDIFKRQDIEKHVQNECPLTEINCPLHYAGCEERLPRKDMPDHTKDTATHLSLLATVTQSLLKEN